MRTNRKTPRILIAALAVAALALVARAAPRSLPQGSSIAWS